VTRDDAKAVKQTVTSGQYIRPLEDTLALEFLCNAKQRKADEGQYHFTLQVKETGRTTETIEGKVEFTFDTLPSESGGTKEATEGETYAHLYVKDDLAYLPPAGKEIFTKINEGHNSLFATLKIIYHRVQAVENTDASLMPKQIKWWKRTENGGVRRSLGIVAWASLPDRGSILAWISTAACMKPFFIPGPRVSRRQKPWQKEPVLRSTLPKTPSWKTP